MTDSPGGQPKAPAHNAANSLLKGRYSLWLILPLSLIIGLSTTFALMGIHKNKNTSAAPANSVSSPASTNTSPSNVRDHYPFLNPTLDVTGELYEIKPFRNKVEAYIQQKKKEGTIVSASVFFRSMYNG